METIQIEITKSDLEEYYRSLKSKGIIRKARVNIYRIMPEKLKAVFKNCINDLECTDYVNGIYKIVAQTSSNELQEFLNNFIFKLKNDENSI